MTIAKHIDERHCDRNLKGPEDHSVSLMEFSETFETILCKKQAPDLPKIASKPDRRFIKLIETCLDGLPYKMSYHDTVAVLKEQVALTLSSKIFRSRFSRSILRQPMNNRIGLQVCAKVERAVKQPTDCLVREKTTAKCHLAPQLAVCSYTVKMQTHCCLPGPSCSIFLMLVFSIFLKEPEDAKLLAV